FGMTMSFAQCDSQINTEAAAAWLLAADSPRSLATGLVLKTAVLGPDLSYQDATIDLISGVLEQDQSPVTLSLLSLSCMQANIENDCIDLGLDAAIVAHDQANLMVRGFLLASDSDAFSDAMSQAQSMDDRIYDMAVAVNDSLRSFAEANQLGPLGTETQAIAFSMAWAIPALKPLTTVCQTTEVNEVQACLHIAQLAASSKSSLVTEMLSWGIRKQLADAAGRPDQVAALDAQRQAYNARFMCLQFAPPPDYWMEIDGATREAYLIEAAEHGEFAAAEMLAANFGTDCPPAITPEESLAASETKPLGPGSRPGRR
ncbi:MAG: hypothetical protein AAGJ52_13850, partial [Pseudomonadota bacterium]